MISTAVLLTLLLVATVTDVRQGKIFNWTTYPGMLVALVASGLATLLGIDATSGSEAEQHLFGFVHIGDSALGLFACGAIMLMCYVFFAGRIGGGDVKLIAMMGAFLGLYLGLEAMLWTFTIAAGLALIRLVWRYGAIRLIIRAVKYVTYFLRLGRMGSVDEQDRVALQTHLYLSPSALIAVLIVHYRLAETIW